jgi:UDP-N-acetylglucosamine--dolichyl-phosphate N-acetylglucosaminephosphotransferase
VAAAALAAIAVIAALVRGATDAGLLGRVGVVVALSAVAGAATATLVAELAPAFARAGRVGKDINKRGAAGGDVPVPESLGLVPATVYLIVLCLLHAGDLAELDGDAGGEARLYTAAMASVAFMVLLGFADDVLDLKWRYNLALPLVASMPLLVNYAGSTSVLVPSFARRPVSWAARVLFGGGATAGRLVDLGVAYYVYMALLSIFCTNAINIYAGINGLEAGQSAVIAAFVLLHNAANLNPAGAKDNLELLRSHHVFSVELVMPFAAVTLGLLRHNWYPSVVFVGDTYCYFAGMTFAMASILGHYSETLLLFFIPQLINFVYSLPQLLGLVPCPRHRLPHFNPKTGRLEAVRSHLNLVNLALWVTGPLCERDLCAVLLIFQAVCCCAGLAIRAVVLQYVGGGG